jgi:hypothetical protein
MGQQLVFAVVVLVLLIVVFKKLQPENFNDFSGQLNNDSNHFKSITNMNDSMGDAGDSEFKDGLNDLGRHYKSVAGIGAKPSVLQKIAKAVGLTEHARFDHNEDPLFAGRRKLNLSSKLY